MSMNEIPKTFLKNYIQLDDSNNINIMKNFSNFNLIQLSVFTELLSDTFDIEEKNKYLYNYYYKIKKTWPSKVKSLNIEVEERAINNWSNNSNSLAFDFKYITKLSKATVKKAIYNDLMHSAIKYIDNNYSGSIQNIFTKTTDLVLSGVFGKGMSLADLSKNPTRSDLQIDERTNRVILFTEEDAKIINTIYQLGFNQLIKGSKARLIISDITMQIYGNRWTKNKDRILSRLILMNKYMTHGAYYNEDGILEERSITFIPEITIIHEKSKVVEIEYSSTFRKLMMNNIIIEENSLDVLPKNKENYTYLVHEVIKKIRIEHYFEQLKNNCVNRNPFIFSLSFTKLRDHINIEDNPKTRENIKAALQSIMENTNKLESFEVLQSDYTLIINSLTDAEANYITRLKIELNS